MTQPPGLSEEEEIKKAVALSLLTGMYLVSIKVTH